MKRTPGTYYLKNAGDGTGAEWELGAFTNRGGSGAKRKTLYLPRADAESVKAILEGVYGEKWTVEEETAPSTSAPAPAKGF